MHIPSEGIVFPVPQHLYSVNEAELAVIANATALREGKIVVDRDLQQYDSHPAKKDEFDRMLEFGQEFFAKGIAHLTSDHVQIDFDFLPVPSGWVQRSPRWHFDSQHKDLAYVTSETGLNNRAMRELIVSTALGTSFASGFLPQGHPLLEHLYVGNQRELLHTDTIAAIDKGELAMSQAERLVMVGFSTAHLHRGTENDKPLTLPRRMIRFREV